MLAERAKKAMRPCDRAHAAQDFERGYAESVAYHKQNLPQIGPSEPDAQEMREAA
jgi:hypothetical protein